MFLINDIIDGAIEWIAYLLAVAGVGLVT